MNFFRSFIFYIFFYVGTVCFFLTFSPVQLFSYKFVVYLSNLWTRSVIKLSKLILGIDYIISGLENIPKEGSFIVASNHQSAWETFFFGSLFPGSVYILKDELKQIPILRGYFNRLGFIFVERNKTFKSLKTVLRSARRLTKNQNKVFVIFPEGTRLSPGETGKINPGFFAIHKFLKIPILPIKLNSGDHWINKKFSKKSGTINVKIFPLIKNVSSKEKIVDILKKSFY